MDTEEDGPYGGAIAVKHILPITRNEREALATRRKDPSQRGKGKSIKLQSLKDVFSTNPIENRKPRSLAKSKRPLEVCSRRCLIKEGMSSSLLHTKKTKAKSFLKYCPDLKSVLLRKFSDALSNNYLTRLTFANK